MKSTGIVRKVDELGRIVVPKELRRTLGIEIKEPIEIYVDGDKIILKKYAPKMSCVVTGEVSDNNLTLANGKLVLSEEGAKEVMSELQNFLQTK